MTKSDSSIDGCEPGVYLPCEASELACARASSCICASLYLSSLPPQILMHDDCGGRRGGQGVRGAHLQRAGRGNGRWVQQAAAGRVCGCVRQAAGRVCAVGGRVCAVGRWAGVCVRACLQGARVGEGEGEGALAVELVDLVEVDRRVLLRDAAWCKVRVRVRRSGAGWGGGAAEARRLGMWHGAGEWLGGAG